MIGNYLNLSETDLDRPIYRVFSKRRFDEVLQTKKLVLVWPSKWDDPFENYIMNSTGELKDGTPFQIDFRKRFYGQCWTLKKESDAIWRIYAPKKDGVKVQTTIRKLFNALYNHEAKFRDMSCFIGKVTYHKKETLTAYLKDGVTISKLITDQRGIGQASTLLFKRLAFNHEKEVRLIYYATEKLITDKFYLSVDPFDLFDQITIDPRVTYSDFRLWKKEFRSMGFKKKIIRSLLYKVPDLSFKFEG